MALNDTSLRTRFLLIIIVLAVFTRIWGISWSLPYVYHVDEAWFSKKSIDYFTGDLNPHFFEVPSLYTYLVAGVWKAYYWVGTISGKFSSAEEFRESFTQDPTVFFILGRLVTVLLSLGTIVIVFFIGDKMYNPRVGFFASLFLIFSPEHNKISHYLVPDSPMIFFLILSFLFIWFIYKKGSTKFYILAGLMAGLGTATKYGGQLLFLPLFLAHTFYILDHKKPLKNIFLSPNLVLAALMFMAGFFVGCPYAVLDFRTFWRDFKLQSEHLLSQGHFGSSTAQPAWLFYLQYGFRENIGLLSQFLVLGGVIYGLIRRKKRELLLFSYPLFLFVLIGTWKTSATRYLLPLAPFFILISASFLDILLNSLSSFFPPAKRFKLDSTRKNILTSAVVILFLILPAFLTLRFDYTITQPDTRTSAKDWINLNIPRGSNIALEMYGPPISRRNYNITIRHSLSQIDLEWLARRKTRYVVISDIMYARFTRYPQEFPKEAGFYNSLDEKAVLLKTFKPKWDEYLIDLHNPTIKIYRLSSCPTHEFPGNFKHYSQRVDLTRTSEGSWILKSSISGEALTGTGEVVRDPYVRVTDAEGRELSRLTILEGEITLSQSFTCSNTTTLQTLPIHSEVSIGYEYEIHPNTFPFQLEQSLKKKYLFKEKIGERTLQKQKIEYIFLFSTFTNRHGDDYFQQVILSKTTGTWNLSSSIFGDVLRWGDDHVLNPSVRVMDEAGKEIEKFILFNGKVGAIGADRKAPLERSITLLTLPEKFRISIGYDYYYDDKNPEKAGGPESLELNIPPDH